MKPDHEERLAAEAHREMRILRIVRDPRIGALSEPLVLLAQRLQSSPQLSLEPLFRGRCAAFEQNDKRLEWHGIGTITCTNLKQARHNPEIVPGGAEVACDDKADAIAIGGRLGPYAGKFIPVDKVEKSLSERVL